MYRGVGRVCKAYFEALGRWSIEVRSCEVENRKIGVYLRYGWIRDRKRRSEAVERCEISVERVYSVRAGNAKRNEYDRNEVYWWKLQSELYLRKGQNGALGSFYSFSVVPKGRYLRDLHRAKQQVGGTIKE